MRRQGPHLLILNYHRASAGSILQHMRYLQRHYRILHLDEALEELYHVSQGNKKSLLRTPLVLTFDDGYHDNYTHAFKAAVELQVPITIFLIPGYLDSGDFFWWGEGKRLVAQTTVEEILFEGHIYHLRTVEAQQQLSALIDMRLRTASSVAGRDQFLSQIRQALAISEQDYCRSDLKDDNIPLTWCEVLKMQQSGLVCFGAHTMHHPVLSYLSDPSEVHYEVARSREILEARLGNTIRTFAYPIGRTEHIGEEALKAVREAMYTWAVTTTKGIATPQSDPYRLERVLVDVRRHWLLIAAETSGIWSLLAPLWKPFINEGADI
ncbi:hypothetical protein KDI_17760 [Dictyobacter arantiisoli]|uniref:NodB homology domain-containing protein n=2 Tax=Dictyobacter arantiisoli TaxID=2014874 RepID=A0A5A5T9W6_9CHLR|nr:hypothetical protein KDI_17760 [Dictyobacter arantiisoli]